MYYRHIQLSLGYRIATFLERVANSASSHPSFCGCLFVFVYLSLWWCWKLDVDLIASVPEFTYLLCSSKTGFNTSPSSFSTVHLKVVPRLQFFFVCASAVIYVAVVFSLQSNLSCSNIFGTMQICLRYQ